MGGCCGSGRGSSGGRGRYKVILPGGKFAIKQTMADAELLKAKYPGARIVKVV